MKLLIILATLSLAACTSNTIQQAQYEKSGNPSDVAACRYEAEKTQVTYTARTAGGQVFEEMDRKAQVFNACMAYRSGRS